MRRVKDKLLSVFKEVYEHDSGGFIFVSAPGRVNLIGEHTDYNGGFVLPSAISLRTYVMGIPRKDDKIRVYSLNLKESFEITFDDFRPQYHWSSYAIGPFYVLLNEGYPLRGVDFVLYSEVPSGGGLSSSASIEVAVSLLLREAFSLSLSPLDLALVSKKAENEYVTAPCGVMDQMTSSLGKTGSAMFIDCRSLEYEYVNIPKDWKIVVCDTGVRHSVAGGEYKRRQEECQQGVEEIRKVYPDVRSLRDVSEDMLFEFKNKLKEKVFKRCHYVLKENERVKRAVRAISEGRVEEVKALFLSSHEGLRDEYEVSCPELDALVECALESRSLVGTRMTGAGFGGNTINFVKKDGVWEFVEHVNKGYFQRTGRKAVIRVVEADDGARVE